MQLTDALPGTFGLLSVSFVDSKLPLFGGIVHPALPVANIPVSVAADGSWTFELEKWSYGLAPGTELFWQAGLIDPAAVEGIALSNALQSIQP